jgi:hypothetical protein
MPFDGLAGFLAVAQAALAEAAFLALKNVRQGPLTMKDYVEIGRSQWFTHSFILLEVDSRFLIAGFSS